MKQDIVDAQQNGIPLTSPSLSAGKQGRRVRRVIDYLQVNLGNEVGLAELALMAGLSVDHFARIFRSATGDPPHRWLIRRRVERASQLLLDPGRSVTEIAMICGFASSQHLATVFRRYVGVAPTRYRQLQASDCCSGR